MPKRMRLDRQSHETMVVIVVLLIFCGAVLLGAYAARSKLLGQMTSGDPINYQSRLWVCVPIVE